jgi:hypothetical protein
MKKVFSFAAIAALTMFAASCGNDEAEAKRKADSAHQADSVAAVMAQWRADSTRVADSTANAAKQMEAQRIADSIRVADSLAKLKPGKAPKTPTEKKKEENKKATSGRG